MTAYFDPDTLQAAIQPVTNYVAVCPHDDCDWKQPHYTEENARSDLNQHLTGQWHFCECENGWVINNPDWPLGEGHYRERCPEGCETS